MMDHIQSHSTRKITSDEMAMRRDLLYECSMFRLTCIFSEDPHKDFQESVNKYRDDIEETYKSVIDNEHMENVFCWYLMNHIDMKKQRITVGATEIEDFKYLIPDFVIFGHKNGTEGSDGNFDATAAFSQNGPLWDENRKYYRDLTHEKILKHGFNVAEPTGGWTFDTWNQARAALFLRQGDVHNHPDLRPLTIVWRRIIHEEVFLCGSVRENVATTLVDHSDHSDTDFDEMICRPIPGTLCDDFTRPGYTWIVIPQGEAREKSDRVNFMLSLHQNLKNLEIAQKEQERKPMIGRQFSAISGPAIALFTDPNHTGKAMDQVHGYYSRDRAWPAVAEEWRRRDRSKLSGWPPQALINRAVSHGTYVVPVAHKNSRDLEIEWRYSFSKAEVDLMLSISKKQRKCYMLTKRLCQLIFAGFKIFCSYFVKTSFFWMMEEMPTIYWNRMTMDDLVDYLLDKIIFYFAEHKLPNYFIRQSNLIDHLPQEHLETVRQKLKSIQLRRMQGLPQYVLKDISFYWINFTVEPRDKTTLCILSVRQHAVVFMLLYRKDLRNYKSQDFSEILTKYWELGRTFGFCSDSDSESSWSVRIPDMLERLKELGLAKMLGLSAKFTLEEINRQFSILMSSN